MEVVMDYGVRVSWVSETGYADMVISDLMDSLARTVDPLSECDGGGTGYGSRDLYFYFSTPELADQFIDQMPGRDLVGAYRLDCD
jgi:hypothetical protein